VGFHHLDQFAGVDSAITRRSPTVRLLGTVIVAIGAALLPLGAWPQLLALGVVVLALAALARLRPGPFLFRLLPPLAFVGLVSLGVLVLAPGRTVATLGPLRVTDAGVLRFATATGRAAVALGAAVILVSTTPFPDLLRAFRSLRLPRAVTTSLGLAYRYLYLLNDEVERIRRAARSRNAGAGSAPKRRLYVGIAAAALQRSYARSDRVYQAMLGRGYTGELPSLRAPAYHGRPVLETAALAALVAAITASAIL
jgi:cobalt/nickel transport system permease protein